MGWGTVWPVAGRLRLGQPCHPLETWGLPLLLCWGNFSPSLTVLGVYCTMTQKRERTPWGCLEK